MLSRDRLVLLITTFDLGEVFVEILPSGGERSGVLERVGQAFSEGIRYLSGTVQSVSSFFSPDVSCLLNDTAALSAADYQTALLTWQCVK